MLSSTQAREAILARIAGASAQESVALDGAAGRVLAAEVRSDVDLPPFEKSAMDGFAVHSSDFDASRAPDGERELSVIGESRAGAPFDRPVPAGACAAIYTGAELPSGCDAVVMVERSEEVASGRVRLRDRPEAGQHVCHVGQDLARGDLALEPGRRLRDVDLAVLAAVGCEPVPVFARPRVAVITSGDELVEPSRRPGVGEIREGNTLHLAAMARRAGAEVVRRAIVRDDPALLEAAFGGALDECDALITTGGVSMGRYDLVGQALERLGVELVFHRVAIKPGKPLWFGVRGTTPVFALPGNPVSCLVNFTLFVRTALQKLSGERVEPRLEARRRGRWHGRAVRSNPREQFIPARRSPDPDGGERLEPVPWNGSADVVGIARAEALAVVPSEAELADGALCEWIALE
jgi:molybdopterin molybdotransferase